MVKNKRSFFAVILEFVMMPTLMACGTSNNNRRYTHEHPESRIHKQGTEHKDGGTASLAEWLSSQQGLSCNRSYRPMLSVKEQSQSVYAERLTEVGYVTLVFDGTYFGESEGMPRGQELPEVKESDIESAVDYLCSLPYVDKDRIGGLGICTA